ASKLRGPGIRIESEEGRRRARPRSYEEVVTDTTEHGEDRSCPWLHVVTQHRSRIPERSPCARSSSNVGVIAVYAAVLRSHECCPRGPLDGQPDDRRPPLDRGDIDAERSIARRPEASRRSAAKPVDASVVAHCDEVLTETDLGQHCEVSEIRG